MPNQKLINGKYKDIIDVNNIKLMNQLLEEVEIYMKDKDFDLWLEIKYGNCDDSIIGGYDYDTMDVLGYSGSPEYFEEWKEGHGY